MRYRKSTELARGRNVPSKEQLDNVRMITLKHRYHKPYQTDWRQATAYARAKSWQLWHMEKEKR